MRIRKHARNPEALEGIESLVVEKFSLEIGLDGEKEKRGRC